MDSTICIFSDSKGECSGRKNSHIPHLICGNHLKQFYGLEVAVSYIESPTEVAYVGWTLKPTPGTFFKKNEVILPIREIIDKIYRPKEVVMDEGERIYKINNKTANFLKRLSDESRLSTSERFTYELIRNLSEVNDKINMNPTLHCEENPKHIGFLRSKMTLTDTYVNTDAIINRIAGMSVAANNNDRDETALSQLELSYSFQYMLSKLEYTVHAINDGASREVNRLIPNAKYVRKVGLVALTDIADPEIIVVLGSSRADKAGVIHEYYNGIVQTVPKEINHTILHSSRIPTQSVNRALMTNCVR